MIRNTLNVHKIESTHWKNKALNLILTEEPSLFLEFLRLLK